MIDTKLKSISNPIAIKRSVIELTNPINKELTTKYLVSNNIKILIARVQELI